MAAATKVEKRFCELPNSYLTGSLQQNVKLTSQIDEGTNSCIFSLSDGCGRVIVFVDKDDKLKQVSVGCLVLVPWYGNTD